VQEAETQLENDTRTPNEDSSRQSLEEARSVVEALTARRTECRQASTTTTEAPTSTTQPRPIQVVVNSDSLGEGFEGRVDPVTELAFGDDAAAAMAGAAEERGSNALSHETLNDVPELLQWVNDTNNPDAVLTRAHVVDAITAKCGAEDVAVHLERGEGWLLMVVRPASQIMGTGYRSDSGISFATHYRETAENDGYWLPVCTQGPNVGDVAWDGVVRADCGNPNKNPRIRIERPDTPDVPPVEIPPGEECPFFPGQGIDVDSPLCLVPKDPTQNIDRNPFVPPGTRGPGTTPVGGDVGDATETFDTETGCEHSCDTGGTGSGGSGGSGGGGGTTDHTGDDATGDSEEIIDGIDDDTAEGDLVEDGTCDVNHDGVPDDTCP
jgi:hypothetical protein